MLHKKPNLTGLWIHSNPNIQPFSSPKTYNYIQQVAVLYRGLSVLNNDSNFNFFGTFLFSIYICLVMLMFSGSKFQKMFIWKVDKHLTNVRLLCCVSRIYLIFYRYTIPYQTIMLNGAGSKHWDMSAKMTFYG